VFSPPFYCIPRYNSSWPNPWKAGGSRSPERNSIAVACGSTNDVERHRRYKARRVKSADWPRSPAIPLFPLYSIAPSDLSLSRIYRRNWKHLFPGRYPRVTFSFERRINARSAGMENRNEGEAELRATRYLEFVLSSSLPPSLSLFFPPFVYFFARAFPS